MFEKVNAVINLFRKGSEVSNVEAWKNGGISVAALAAAMGALAQFGDAFGVHVAITPEQLNGLAVGVVTLVGVVLPVITSKRAGLLPAASSQRAPIEDHSFSDGLPAIPAPVATSQVQHQPQPAMADSDNPLAGLDTTFRG
ncbi:hypothetical protein [Undibacterium sp. TS12]|uniref:hypothetical protein n=1 Tax=Undibacterium sp. TS12 TaxID=2908202 RepID=UPI001F4D1BF7|nr:hypothetical protein [Undibacterium sp. TS12]MCH8622627.1 hypothetical protein [Undibacterium sp. TS12]